MREHIDHGLLERTTRILLAESGSTTQSDGMNGEICAPATRYGSTPWSVGQQVPVVMTRGAERFVLIDGYLLVEALRRLDRDTAIAMMWVSSDRKTPPTVRHSRRPMWRRDHCLFSVLLADVVQTVPGAWVGAYVPANAAVILFLSALSANVAVFVGGVL